MAAGEGHGPPQNSCHGGLGPPQMPSHHSSLLRTAGTKRAAPRPSRRKPHLALSWERRNRAAGRAFVGVRGHHPGGVATTTRGASCMALAGPLFPWAGKTLEMPVPWPPGRLSLSADSALLGPERETVREGGGFGASALAAATAALGREGGSLLSPGADLGGGGSAGTPGCCSQWGRGGNNPGWRVYDMDMVGRS